MLIAAAPARKITGNGEGETAYGFIERETDRGIV
jgi:hypothetical protein